MDNSTTIVTVHLMNVEQLQVDANPWPSQAFKPRVLLSIPQGAYNSGKHGNLREFVNSGKLREFKIYSGNLSDSISWALSYVHNCQ